MGRNLRAGFSIVEALVVLTILSIASIGLSRVFTLSLRAGKHVEIRDEVEQLRQYVRTNVDCAATFSSKPPTCEAGAPDGFFAVQRKSQKSSPVPPPLIETFPTTSTKFGLYFLRASCVTSGGAKTMKVEFKRAISIAAPGLQDPLNRNLVYDWQDLLPGAPSLCSLSGADSQVELQTGAVVSGAPVASGGQNCGGLSAPTPTADYEARPWTGAVGCRAGYYAVAGGGYAFSPVWSAVALLGLGGAVQATDPSTTLSGFNVTICVYTKKSVPAGVQAPGTIWATCVRKE